MYLYLVCLSDPNALAYRAIDKKKTLTTYLSITKAREELCDASDTYKNVKKTLGVKATKVLSYTGLSQPVF